MMTGHVCIGLGKERGEGEREREKGRRELGGGGEGKGREEGKEGDRHISYKPFTLITANQRSACTSNMTYR